MDTCSVTGWIAPLSVGGEEDTNNFVLDISEVPIPLMFCGGNQVGWLTHLTLTENDELEVRGSTDSLQPGYYRCGVNLSHVFVDSETDTMLASIQLTGITAYPLDSDEVPSFPDGHLKVEVIRSAMYWKCHSCLAEGDSEGPRNCPNCGVEEVYTYHPEEADRS